MTGYLWELNQSSYSSQLLSTITITPPPPSFMLSGPTSGTFTAGQIVTIQWTAGNIDGGSSVSLAYDTTTNWGNPKWIEIGAVTAANGSASYGWNTTGVAAGTYYLGGYLYDSNHPYNSHLLSAITITAAPTTLQGSSAAGSYGGTATLTTTLLCDGGGVSSETINFSLNGSSVGTAITDNNGDATLSGVSLAGFSVGTYGRYLVASFAGDGSYLATNPRWRILTSAKRR